MVSSMSKFYSNGTKLADFSILITVSYSVNVSYSLGENVKVSYITYTVTNLETGQKITATDYPIPVSYTHLTLPTIYSV